MLENLFEKIIHRIELSVGQVTFVVAKNEAKVHQLVGGSTGPGDSLLPLERKIFHQAFHLG